MKDFFKDVFELFEFLNKKQSTCVYGIFVSICQRSDDSLGKSVYFLNSSESQASSEGQAVFPAGYILIHLDQCRKTKTKFV